MTFQEFDLFFDSLIDEARKMRDTKGREYSHGVDRFDNFNRLSASNNISRLKVANILLSKHIDSINSYVKEERTFSEETIRGRFIDVIVYAALMAGMIHESSAPTINSGWKINDVKIETTMFPHSSYSVCGICGIKYSDHIMPAPISCKPAPCKSETGKHTWVIKEETK